MNNFLQWMPISLMLLLSPDSLHAADHAATLQPYVSADVVGVAYVDLTKLDPPAIASWVAEVGSLSEEERTEIQGVAEGLRTLVSGLTDLGVERIYWLLRTSDIADQGPTWIVPLRDSAAATNVQTLLMFGSPEREGYLQADAPAEIPKHWRTDSHNTLIGGYNENQVQAQLDAKPVNRDLADAWDALGDGACGILVWGTPDTRRVVREMLPPLPAPFDTINGPLLADDVRWGGAAVSFPPQPSATVEIETTNRETATRLQQAINGGLQLAESVDEINQLVEPGALQTLIKSLSPQVSGSRLKIAPTEITDNAERLMKILSVPIQQARQAAERNARINQFKQIALAVHNYASRHKSLPTQANYNADGKPFLSWRVHILPWLEQYGLYKEFHLDEPWDSEHNRALVKKMPAIYADPDSALKNLAAEGKTTFQLPVGAGTLYDGPTPKTFKDINDGTANTIMVVEVPPEDAVIWTKPEDWQVDFDDPWKGLRRNDRDWFTAGYWDGHVSIISQSMKAETLRALLTPAGGEMVGGP